MSNIDKLKSAAAKAVDNFDPNMFVETRDVLALLDELEVATYACNGWQRKFAESDERLEAAEKRIAELEEREVKLPKPISVLHRRDFGDAHRSIYAYPEAEVNAALSDAGIRIHGED